MTLITAPSETVRARDVVIVGAGVAGLFTALQLAPRPVTVLTARKLGRGGSSPWAQGGVAAAMAPDDSPALHAEDTIAAGAGLVDDAAARVLCAEGPARIDDLARYGVQFDRDATGAYKVGREAAHRRNRILHASGDQAGAAIMAALNDAARAAEHIEIVERVVVEDLLTDDKGRVGGVLAFDVDRQTRVDLAAGAVVLATGGLGGLYAVTTNPVRAKGHGLAFAARAGAVVRDAEFVQFHPTALDVGVDPAPLATEALRGAGARLLDADGRAFMVDYDAAGDLAPRDVVARAVATERAAGRGAYLDARDAVGPSFPTAFPPVYAAARDAGLDPRAETLPVAPAAHYHMGGVQTDLYGRASVEGLWAVGEVASTGVHGANRLASNSLLEAVVFGGRIAEALRDGAVIPAVNAAAPPDRLALPPAPAPQAAAEQLRRGMADAAAIVRDAAGLARMRSIVRTLRAAPDLTSGLLSGCVAADLILAGAAAREESRGGHTRSDFPERAAAAYHSQARLTVDGAVAVDPAPPRAHSNDE
ncbi:MAG: L-aspartate oxidase [Pseudomonadota bacterium]